MKKLSLVFALMFIVASAMAQNSATVTQTGDNHDATVTQTGSSSATVTQSTDDNYGHKATVLQNGAANIVNVNQIEENTGTNHSTFASVSTISQIGDNNAADVDLFETGGGDKGNIIATLNQTGDENSGIQYVNAPGYSSGHQVIANQTGNLNISNQNIDGGYTNYYEVSQNGDENSATQRGHGSTYAEAKIIQLGGANQAIQDVTGSNNGYMAAIIKIDQNGERNLAHQDFTGSGYNHKNNGIITQMGWDNVADQIAVGRSLDLQILQEGELNVANQNATGDNYTLGYGYLKITQTGYSNHASQVANGNGIKGEIIQTGDYNDATMQQTGNMHNAIITQTGDNNVSTVIQN